jgi:hypothetical protein
MIARHRLPFPGGGGLPPAAAFHCAASASTQRGGPWGKPGSPMKKSWGHRFRDGPNPVTSVELVEALPAETAARNASPLRWLGDSP